MAWAEAGQAGGFLEGEEDPFLTLTHLIGWDFPFHSAAATPHIF
jgi:hypothetical protein